MSVHIGKHLTSPLRCDSARVPRDGGCLFSSAVFELSHRTTTEARREHVTEASPASVNPVLGDLQ